MQRTFLQIKTNHDKYIQSSETFHISHMTVPMYICIWVKGLWVKSPTHLKDIESN